MACSLPKSLAVSSWLERAVAPTPRAPHERVIPQNVFGKSHPAPSAPRRRPAALSSSPIQQRYRLLLRLAGSPPGSPPASTATPETGPRLGRMSVALSGLLASWGTAFLAGRAGYDDALHR